MNDATGTPTGTGQWLPIAEAARRLGITTDAIRKRISSGAMRGRRDDGTRYWLVWLPLDVIPVAAPEPPEPPPEGRDLAPETLPGVSPAAPDVPPEPGALPPERAPEDDRTPDAVAALARGLEQSMRLVEKLQEENRNLAGQLGFREAQLQQANETIRVLQAPPPEVPPDMAVAPPEPPEQPRRWWDWWLGR